MIRRALIALAGLAVGAPALAQAVDPFYAGSYTLVDLGSVPVVPPNYGGAAFLAGNPNVLLLGGAANNPAGVIYRVDLVRDGSGNITGFSGTPTLVSTAPQIDGGVVYAPQNVLLFTEYPNNALGELRPGSSVPDRTIDLNALAITSSVGAIAYVPPGFPGAGKLKIVSYNAGTWYSASLQPDGNGTFDVTQVTQTAQLSGGPEGVVYVPTNSPLFGTPSILLDEYGNGAVVSYQVDANGDPLVGTRRAFITGLFGAEGAAIDPITGQFLFSTYGGGNHVVVVRGFAAPPCYPNCDNSTSTPILNVNDFICFQSRFAAGDSYANCDHSTSPPVLNVNDFVCFQSAFAAGCR